jgi:hypothetical protein
MNVKRLLKGLSATLLFLLVPAAMAHSADNLTKDVNLITNPGFEMEDPAKPGKPSGWMFVARRIDEGGMSLVDDIVKSGKKSVRLAALKYTPPGPSSPLDGVSIISDRYPVPPAQSIMKVSGWLKAQDIKMGKAGWHKLVFTANVWDEKGARLKYWDIISTEGTFEWKKFERKIVIPEGAKTISLQVRLVACTGTAWVDDVELKLVSLPPNHGAIVQQAKTVGGLVVFPHPWKLQDSKKKIELTELSLSIPEKDSNFKDALFAWLDAEGISYHRASLDEEKAATGGLLFASDSSSKAISDRLSLAYHGANLKDLGDQGYFLSVASKDGKPSIFIGANTEQGRFYALQSLKQLLSRKDGRSLIAETNILDKPAFSRRGIAMGPWWFNKKDIAIERLVNLKCNYVWQPLPSKNTWRQPLAETQKKALSEYVEACRKNFITPAVSVAPRGTPPVQYSSDADINLMLDKLSDLYNVGYRDFGINFDDLQNIEQERLVVPADIKKFDNNIGKAHVCFVNEVYKRFREKHPDINFGVIPMVYSRFCSLPDESPDYANKAYLRELSNLPPEITFVSCPVGMEAIHEVTRLTKRPPLIWDNFFATWSDKGIVPVFVPPFHWTNGLKDSDIKGYIFLPCALTNEDAAGTSWLTAADFFWNGDRRNQDQSYRAAVVRAAGGGENLDAFKDYSNLSSRLNEYAIPGKSKEERLRYVQSSIAELQQWKKNLVPVLSKNLSNAVDKEINTYLTNLAMIEKDMQAKPFSIKVKRVTGLVNIDGLPDEDAWSNADPVTGLLLFRGGTKLAQQQTVFKFLYDNEYLYVSATCLEPSPGSVVATRKQRGSNVFQDDCVEIFLSPNANDNYYHIVVNTIGTIYDKFSADLKWHGNYKVTAQLGTDSWTLEMAIPFKELGVSRIKPGDRWTFNVCRERYAVKPVELSSYALLVKRGFHIPSRFEVLEFE